jgi:hypothetical protein
LIRFNGVGVALVTAALAALTSRQRKEMDELEIHPEETKPERRIYV